MNNSFAERLLAAISPKRIEMAPFRILLSIYVEKLADMQPFPKPPTDVHTDPKVWNEWLTTCRDSLINHPVFLVDDPVVQRDRRILDVCFFLASPIVLDALEIGFDYFELEVDAPKSVIRPVVEDYPLHAIDGDDVFAQVMNGLIDQIRQQKHQIKLTALVYAFQNIDRSTLNELIEAMVKNAAEDDDLVREGVDELAGSSFHDFHKAFRQTDVDPNNGQRDMLIWWMVHDWDKKGFLFNSWKSFINKSFAS